MEDQASIWKILGNSKTRREVVLIRVHQAFGVAQLSPNENGRNAIVKNQVRVGALLVVERAGVLVAKAKVKSRRRRHLPAIFGKARRAPRAQIHLWHASLALLHRRQAKQQAGQSGPASIVETKFGGINQRVLVKDPVLKETQHRPEVTMEFDAKLHTITAAVART